MGWNDSAGEAEDLVRTHSIGAYFIYFIIVLSVR